MSEVILAGRPNSGKSTLFNRLASANQKVGNYAGCTVEKKTASVQGDQVCFEITDLPGMYSLQANSIDEKVALKHLENQRDSSLVVLVVDGNNLEQELILPIMLKKQGYQLAIAVNMMDEVRANQKVLKLAGISDLVGIPFFPIAAKLGEGIEPLKRYLERRVLEKNAPAALRANSDMSDLYREARTEARDALKGNVEGRKQNSLLARDQRIDGILLHPLLGPVVFLLTMFVLFQSIFTWAKPLSNFLQAGMSLTQEWVKSVVPYELLASLLSDGVLAGVGAVITFVPQIAILFLLIGVLEYSGYLPRIAYMVDRLMKPYGLDGKVFIPLLSSVACAVPGIMATRTIESEKRRLLTIMVSPLMTCSARLPVYTLLISTFIPNRLVGPFQLPGLVMFGMYLLGVVMALVVALVLHTFDKGAPSQLVDIIHLPHYRSPNWRELLRFVWNRVWVFLRKAGTVIAGMAILLWVLLSFPRSSLVEEAAKIERFNVTTYGLMPEQQQKHFELIDNNLAKERLVHSFGGRLGIAIEPLFRPLGYDWRLTIGILASLAAREVFVSTLGTVFALGSGDGRLDHLSEVLLAQKTADGKPLYTIATCLSLLVFFAFSLQCISTIGVARRETNSWRIPAVMFAYMFALAYGGAFLLYHVGSIFFL